ncbi:MAG: hypothetical protein WDN04_02235 [Rhodospirillales bacterium]
MDGIAMFPGEARDHPPGPTARPSMARGRILPAMSRKFGISSIFVTEAIRIKAITHAIGAAQWRDQIQDDLAEI